ncbi:MAG: methyltransferase domain-containing protein [Longicatena sp.]
MIENLTYEYVHGTKVYLYQRKDMFRMNSDTALLANFMKVLEGETLLDIGTNNGALLAVAQTYHPSFLYGIDIQEEAIEVARYNMQELGISNCTLMVGDVCTTPLPKVDVIVCNPPYFKVDEDSNLNTSKALAMARHETYLTLDALCLKVSSLLEEKGRFYMVHRAARLSDIVVTLRKYHLEVRNLQFVYDEAKDEAISVLVEAIKDGKSNTHVLTPKTIER